MPVEIQGLNKLVRGLLALGLEVEDLKAAFSQISREGAALAAGFAPRKSGALAATVRGNNAKNKAVVSAGRGRGVPYAGVQNYGWASKNIPATGFMQRADAIIAPRALNILEREINRAISQKGL